MLLYRALRVLRGCLVLGVCDGSTSKSVLPTSKKASELTKCIRWWDSNPRLCRLRLTGERPHPLGHRGDSSKVKISECPLLRFLHWCMAALCLTHTLAHSHTGTLAAIGVHPIWWGQAPVT